MAYANNKFCWHGLISTDPAKALAFYSEVIGFDVVEVEMGGEPAQMLAAKDIPRAHVMAPPAEGIPSHWDNYLKVDDVDARTAAAVEAGGTLLVPPTDIPPGRFSVVASPSGAAVSLFSEADPATAHNAPGGHQGSVHWVELHSKDLNADLAWLKTAIGLGVDTMPMPDGEYYLLKEGDDMIGGATTQRHESAPAMWLTWLQVDNVDDTLGRVNNNGGEAVTPVMDVEGVGRMAIVKDNTGGVFGVITPAPQQ